MYVKIMVLLAIDISKSPCFDITAVTNKTCKVLVDVRCIIRLTGECK